MLAASDDLPVFDTVHLGKYTLGDRQLEIEVLQLFRQQMDKLAGDLRTAQDQRQWMEAAHSLKGAARGIGAFRLGARALQLEKAGEPLNESIRSALLSLLEADMIAVRQAIEDHLGEDANAVFV